MSACLRIVVTCLTVACSFTLAGGPEENRGMNDVRDRVDPAVGAADCTHDGSLDESEFAEAPPDSNGEEVSDEDEPGALAVSWESVAGHGAVGRLGLVLPADGSFTEPRHAGVTELVVTYDAEVTVADETVVTIDSCDVHGEPADLSGITMDVWQGAPDEMVISFTPALPGSGLAPGTHDPVRYRVELTGVGGAVADTSREFTVVLGDVFGFPIWTGDARVTAADHGFVRGIQDVDSVDPWPPSYYRLDVFTDGRISAADVALVRSHAAEHLNGQGLVVPCP